MTAFEEENRPQFERSLQRWIHDSRLVLEYIRRHRGSWIPQRVASGLSTVLFVFTEWASRAAPTIPRKFLPQLVLLFASGCWKKRNSVSFVKEVESMRISQFGSCPNATSERQHTRNRGWTWRNFSSNSSIFWPRGNFGSLRLPLILFS